MPADRPTLTRERVVSEAVALADDTGLAALSMRALARRLGVEAMSLYHHVRDKSALLDAMLDTVLTEMHLPGPDGDWRAELHRRSVSGRAALRRHRWAVGLMGSRRTPGPATLAHRDALVGCLLAAGFPVPATGTATALVDAHLYGFVLRENALQPGPSFGREFERGLELLLDAVARLREPGGAIGTTAPQGAAAPSGVPGPVEVAVPVLGVDPCPAGWVGAVLVPGAPRPRVVVAPTIDGLVEAVRSEVPIEVVGIDIPIGLPDTTVRRADVLARRELRGGASPVPTTLTRPAYHSPTRADAAAVNRRLSGRGVGAQSFALRAKVLEVDAWLRSGPTVEVLEVRPEVSFRVMAGGAALPRRMTEEGQRARLDALAAAGVARPSVLAGKGYAADDVLDACAVAWTAVRRTAGTSRSLPGRPEVFSDGIPAAIHV